MMVIIPNGKKQTTITLKDILYCPGISPTLVSISMLAKDGYTVIFHGMMCCIFNLKKEVIG